MSARKKAAPKAKAEETAIIAYKGFDQNLQCRGFQYAIGESYEHDGKVKACDSGFHACEYPLHVLRYYGPARSRFAVVEQSGKISRHDDGSKIASSRLTVRTEINLAGIIKAAVEYTLARCVPAKGATSEKPHTVVFAEAERKCATASGDYGAATASGNFGKARGADGCVLFIVYRDENWKIVHAKALIVGQDGVKPNVWYSLDEAGAIVEVES